MPFIYPVPYDPGGEVIAPPESATTLEEEILARIAGDVSSQSYADAAIAAAITGATQGSYLLSGGQVSWESAYTFRVSAAIYLINGVRHTSVEDTVTLNEADGDNDRIDVIAVDVNGSLVVITGTAASEPSEPDVDPSTQLKLAFVLVGAATTEPPAITSLSLYAENLGSGGGEWDWTTSGSGFNVNSTSSPHAGSKTIEGTNVANNAFAQGAGTSINPNSYALLVLFIRPKAAWASNRTLQIGLFSSGTRKGNLITLATGFYGFNSSLTSYQQVAIPVPDFAIPAGETINQIRLTDKGGAIGFYVDDISFQGGGTSGVAVSGISQQEADVRYLSATPGVRTIGVTATALATDDYVFLDPTAGSFTFTLLSAANRTRPITFKNVATNTNVVTVDAAGTETIDGALTIELAAGDSVTLIPRSTSAWEIVK